MHRTNHFRVRVGILVHAARYRAVFIGVAEGEDFARVRVDLRGPRPKNTRATERNGVNELVVHTVTGCGDVDAGVALWRGGKDAQGPGVHPDVSAAETTDVTCENLAGRFGIDGGNRIDVDGAQKLAAELNEVPVVNSEDDIGVFHGQPVEGPAELDVPEIPAVLAGPALRDLQIRNVDAEQFGISAHEVLRQSDDNVLVHPAVRPHLGAKIDGVQAVPPARNPGYALAFYHGGNARAPVHFTTPFRSVFCKESVPALIDLPHGRIVRHAYVLA